MTLLQALDVARTQWYHCTAIVIAGMGFFTDAYDLFSISTLTKLLGRIYYHDPKSSKPGVMPANVLAAVNGVALCGTLAGQLFFGWLGDKMGRRKVFGITLCLMIASSIASGLSFGRKAKGVMTSLCFFRFWLGFGIGGDYPLSATIMSEYANKKTRGAFIAAVFAMQGAGILAASTVSIIVATGFGIKRPSYEEDHDGSMPEEADYIWRIILMVGALPAALTLYWRMAMPETFRYTALVAGDIKKAIRDVRRILQLEIDYEEGEDEQGKFSEFSKKSTYNSGFGLFSVEFAKRHGLHLLGTSASWFLLDIAFYSQNLFQKDIFTSIGWIPPQVKMNAVEEVYCIARFQALIALCSIIPGYWFTVAFVEVLGRKTIQMAGFFLMTVFMLAAAIPYSKLRGNPCGDKFCNGQHIVLVVLYSFSFFFANFGPNSTIFILSAELFPARLRSTCHGISAAFGKAGALVGTLGFLYASQSSNAAEVEEGYHKGIGIKLSLIILAITNGLGMLSTMLLPETKGRSLEEIAMENENDPDRECNDRSNRDSENPLGPL